MVVIGLRWAQVTLTDKPVGNGKDMVPAKHLRVAENRISIGKVIATGTPKSRASRRTLPIPDDVLPVLRAARLWHCQIPPLAAVLAPTQRLPSNHLRARGCSTAYCIQTWGGAQQLRPQGKATAPACYQHHGGSSSWQVSSCHQRAVP